MRSTFVTLNKHYNIALCVKKLSKPTLSLSMEC